MKFLLSVLAVILCVVLLVGLVNGSTSEGGIFGNLGSDSESSSVESSDKAQGSGGSVESSDKTDDGGETPGSTGSEHDGGVVGDVVQVNGMTYATSIDDLPIDLASKKTVASRDGHETFLGNIEMGAASNPDGRISFGYTFSDLKVGQTYVLYYNSIVSAYVSVDHFAYRFGSGSTLYNLRLPDYYNGHLLFEATETSMDFFIAFFDTSDMELVESYANAIDEWTCFDLLEVTVVEK